MLGLKIDLMNSAELSITGRLAEAVRRCAESIADDNFKNAALACLV